MVKDRILDLASDRHQQQVQSSENYDSKATNLISALTVVVTLMGSLFTYALISWNTAVNPAAMPVIHFYPILISGLMTLIISIGLAIMVINPIGQQPRPKLDLEKIHHYHIEEKFSDDQIVDDLVTRYSDFVKDMEEINKQKGQFYKLSTIFALAGLALFATSAGLLITQYAQELSSHPAAPMLLAANAKNSQITLSWQDTQNNGQLATTGYNVYRGTTTDSETFLTKTLNGTSYTDINVKNGQTYFYEITAVNPVGESLKSNELNATLTSNP